MRILDRYIALTFVKIFVGSLLVFAIGSTALDYLSRIGQFGHAERLEGTFAADYSRVGVVIRFYLAYLPYLLKDVLPFVTVAAGLFTVSAMLKGNEVFPVIAAGVSARRLFLPLLGCGALVVVGHLLFQEFAIPKLNRQHIALRRFFSGDRRSEVDNLPHLRDGHGTVTRAGGYRFGDRVLTEVVIQRRWGAAGFERWTAPRLDPDGDAWRAPDGVTRHPVGVAVLETLPKGTRVDIGVTPDEVDALASRNGTAELSFSDIKGLADKFPDRRHLQVALHKQISRPFTSFILLLVGVPILLAAGRSLFFGAGIAFALSAAYYFLDIFFTSLGDRGDLAPELASYGPPALFCSLGVALLATVRT